MTCIQDCVEFAWEVIKYLVWCVTFGDFNAVFYNVWASLLSFGLLALFLYWLNRITKRQRLLLFFGIGESKRLKIYVGHFDRTHIGNVPPDGLVGWKEISTAYVLQSLIRSPIPGLNLKSLAL